MKTDYQYLFDAEYWASPVAVITGLTWFAAGPCVGVLVTLL